MYIYILLGGLFGPDGYLTSRGMYGLRSRLRKEFPDAFILVYQWRSYDAAAQHMKNVPTGRKIVVIGFSGGGSRATWLASRAGLPPIDLMVTYDPSPRWQMVPIGSNVKRAICYYNTSPGFFGLGGGLLVGTNVEVVKIAMNHMLVQSAASLHERTVQAIKRLV